MLQIDTLPLGDYQTNCYIVRPEGAKACLVIDPGYEPEIILSFLKEKGLELSTATLTTWGPFGTWRRRPAAGSIWTPRS